MSPIPPKKQLAGIRRIAHAENSREGFVPLDRNERTEDFPPEAIEEIRALVTPFLLRSYPEPEPLYRELARWLGVSRDQLLLAWGADGGLRAIFDTYVEQGDEVVHAVPSYGMNPVYCAIAGAVERPVPFRADLSLPLEDILKAVNPRTKLVLLANPNQPIERLYTQAELERLLAACSKNGALLVLDEAYHHFCPETGLPLLASHDNLILARTFSKAFGLAGLRLGYLVSQAPNIANLEKVRPMYEAHAFAIAAARYLLKNDRLMKEYVGQVNESRKLLLEALNKAGIQAGGRWGNSVLAELPASLPAAEIAAAFKKKNLLVRAETTPPLSNHLRITLGSPAQTQQFIVCFEEALQSGETPARGRL